MSTGIYKLKFSNGQFYIGQAMDIDARYADHIKKLQSRTHTQKMQAVSDQLNELPGMEVILECHPDYLDLFESFLINQHKGALLLNTSIPRDRLAGITQRTLDVLCENRNNSFVNVLDTLNTYLGRIEGLKLSIDEAENVISDLETKRSEETLQADVSGQIRYWRGRAKEAETKYKRSTIEIDALVEQLEDIKLENKKLRSRGFWARLFNV